MQLHVNEHKVKTAYSTKCIASIEKPREKSINKLKNTSLTVIMTTILFPTSLNQEENHALQIFKKNGKIAAN